MEKQTVVILLAAYNGAKWIGKQIETILKQRDVNISIYISLDISTDNTYNIVNSLANNYSEIMVLPYGQRFGGAAPNFYHLLLNVPIENYDYIAFSDQDDVWLENKLIRAISILKEQDAFGYSSNITAFWEDGRKKIIKKAFPQCKYDFLFESPGPGCSFVLNKALALSIKKHLMTISSLNNLDWHDWFMYAYARSNKYKWVIDNHSYIMYRQHDNNQLGANNGILAFFRRIKDIISGYGIDQTVKTIKYLNLKKDPFVQKWLKNEKIQYLNLAFYSKHCRRKNRDKIFFFIACILMAIFKPVIHG
jgi:rhamnosyltransferase